MATKSASSQASAKSAKTVISVAPPSYEAALAELEELVAKLESGQLPLDQLMAGYARGAELLKFCRNKLDAIDQQISVIDGDQQKPWVQE
jgi:exodeoxyribonuclease VII small subunit